MSFASFKRDAAACGEKPSSRRRVVMPRDKTENHEKILAAAYDEFLEYVKNCGDTAAVEEA